MLRFGSEAVQKCSKGGLGRPKTFNFLAFTHFVSLNRGGQFALRRKTEGKRVSKKLVRALRVERSKAMIVYVINTCGATFSTTGWVATREACTRITTLR